MGWHKWELCHMSALADSRSVYFSDGLERFATWHWAVAGRSVHRHFDKTFFMRAEKRVTAQLVLEITTCQRNGMAEGHEHAHCLILGLGV